LRAILATVASNNIAKSSSEKVVVRNHYSFVFASLLFHHILILGAQVYFKVVGELFQAGSWRSYPGARATRIGFPVLAYGG